MRADVLITFYDQFDKWPLVLWGLVNNKDSINKVIVSKDGRWGDKGLTAIGSGLTIQLVEQDHVGWGAGTTINNGMRHVESDVVCCIDADMALAPGSLANSLRYMNDVGLLAGRVIDTSPDVHLEPISRQTDAGDRSIEMTLVCEQLRHDQRGVQFRSPLPLNLRHGHYLANTRKWLDLGGQPTDEFKVDGVDAYFSQDYVLAAKWMMAYGRDDFAWGGGHAYHLGGIYVAAQESECVDNKRKVRAYLDKYCDMYPDEGKCTWNDEWLDRGAYVGLQRKVNAAHRDGTVDTPDEETAWLDNVLKAGLDFTPTSVLDVGCRTGRSLLAAKKVWPDADVAGCDIVPEFIAVASTRGDAHVEDVHNLSCESDMFDLVTCFGTFEHFHTPAKAASDLWRVARRMVICSCTVASAGGRKLASDMIHLATPQDFYSLWPQPPVRTWEEDGSAWGVWVKDQPALCI